MGRYKLWIALMKEISIGIGYEKEENGHIFLIRFFCIEIIYATHGQGFYFFKT